MGIVWRARQSSVLADRARKIDLMITVRVVLVRGAQLRTDVPPGWESIGGGFVVTVCLSIRYMEDQALIL